MAVVLALGLPAARADASGWSEPLTIASAVDTGYQDPPAIVAGPRGQLVAAWAQTEGIGIAFARRGSRFGAPTVVPGSKGGYAPALGIDAAGNTTIAWIADRYCELLEEQGSECGAIHAAARLRDGTFTRARTLSRDDTDTFWPRVSVAPQGRAAVWWGGLSNEGAGARVARRPGRFGPTELRDRDVQAWTFDGRARAAQVVIRNEHSLVALRREPGGRLTSQHVLVRDERPDSFYPYDVGTDRRGLASALWGDGADLTLGLRLTPNGRLAPQTLARDSERIFAADIDSGRTGLTVAGWARRASRVPFDYDYAYEAPVRARVSLPGRRLGPAQLLAPRYRERPVSAVTASAGPRTAVVAWRGTRPNGSRGIYAAHAGPHGHFGHPRLLSADSTAPVSGAVIAIDRHDRATVAWVDGLRVRVARFR